MKNRTKLPSYADIYIKSKKYNNYVRKSLTTEYNILEGAIRSSMSVANVFALSSYILVSPESLHLVGGTTSTVAR